MSSFAPGFVAGFSGAGASALSDSVIRFCPFSSSLISRICTSTVSPAVMRSLTFTRSCAISDAGINPSTPPKSTNAPKSRTAVTFPRTTLPTSSEASAASRPSRASASSALRRESTMLRPPSLISVTWNASDCPTRSFASTASPRIAIWLVGQNPRRPRPRSTSMPPLLTPVTFPSIATPDARACSICATSPVLPNERPELHLAGLRVDRHHARADHVADFGRPASRRRRASPGALRRARRRSSRGRFARPRPAASHRRGPCDGPVGRPSIGPRRGRQMNRRS